MVHSFWYFQQPSTVDEVLADPATAMSQQRLALAESLAGFGEKYPDVSVHTEIDQGMPERYLLRLADEMDMLVVGAHHGTRAEQFMFGSVSGVARRARHLPGCRHPTVGRLTHRGVCTAGIEENPMTAQTNPAIPTGLAAPTISPWSVASSLALATAIVVASLYGLLAAHPYRDLPHETVVAARAQDACSILVAVLLTVLARRTSPQAHLVRLGLLAYVAYSYAIYLTGPDEPDLPRLRRAGLGLGGRHSCTDCCGCGRPPGHASPVDVWSTAPAGCSSSSQCSSPASGSVPCCRSRWVAPRPRLKVLVAWPTRCSFWTWSSSCRASQPSG